jgi:7-cyano-7-deazaguanine reductase
LTHPEFTSICPLTGAPDFGTITIRYVPGTKLVELKSLRDYLTGFRGRQILQEEIVNEIVDEIVGGAQPLFVEVEGVFNVRGGMATRAVARSGKDPT